MLTAERRIRSKSGSAYQCLGKELDGSRILLERATRRILRENNHGSLGSTGYEPMGVGQRGELWLYDRESGNYFRQLPNSGATEIVPVFMSSVSKGAKDFVYLGGRRVLEPV